MRLPSYRWLQGSVVLACLSWPLPADARTYAEVLAECVTLFTPLVSLEQAQTIVPGVPLLQFSITHGADAAREYDDLAKMTKKIAKERFRDVDQAAFVGATKGYRYTGFGRHYLTLLVGGNSVTLQIADTYPAGTLDGFAKVVLDAAARPELRAWRELK